MKHVIRGLGLLGLLAVAACAPGAWPSGAAQCEMICVHQRAAPRRFVAYGDPPPRSVSGRACVCVPAIVER